MLEFIQNYAERKTAKAKLWRDVCYRGDLEKFKNFVKGQIWSWADVLSGLAEVVDSGNLKLLNEVLKFNFNIDKKEQIKFKMPFLLVIASINNQPEIITKLLNVYPPGDLIERTLQLLANEGLFKPLKNFLQVPAVKDMLGKNFDTNKLNQIRQQALKRLLISKHFEEIEAALLEPEVQFAIINFPNVRQSLLSNPSAPALVNFCLTKIPGEAIVLRLIAEYALNGDIESLTQVMAHEEVKKLLGKAHFKAMVDETLLRDGLVHAITKGDVDNASSLLTQFPNIRAKAAGSIEFELLAHDVGDPEMLDMLRMMKYYDDAVLYDEEYAGIDFSQSHLNERLSAYLHLKGRDASRIINEVGNCNGWAFLYQVYASMGKQKEYFDILSLISQSEIEPEALSRQLPPELSDKYKNLEDLFEHVIHHLVIFHFLSQMSEELSLDWLQSYRIEQYNLIRDPKLGRQLKDLYSIAGNFNNQEQLAEMIDILSHFPGASIDLLVKLEGEPFGHVVSIYVLPNGDLEYYDSNLECRLNHFSDAKNLARHINDNVINGLKMNAYQRNPYLKKDIQPFFSIHTFKFYHANENVPKIAKCEPFQTPQGLSPNGYTPLHFAVFENNIDKAKKIVDANPALLTQKNRLGESPITIAFKLKNQALLLWLLEESQRKGVPCDFAKEISILEIPADTYDEIIRNLYDKGIITTKSVDKNGISLAIWSLIYNENEGIRKIQAMDVNQQDPLGYSLFMMLCIHKFKDFTLFQRFLDTTPVNINLTTQKGMTALIMATFLGHTQMVEELLKRGARVDIVDLQNKTVFDYAKNKPEIMKLLKIYHNPAPPNSSKRASLVFTQPIQETPTFAEENTTQKNCHRLKSNCFHFGKYCTLAENH